MGKTTINQPIGGILHLILIMYNTYLNKCDDWGMAIVVFPTS